MSFLLLKEVDTHRILVAVNDMIKVSVVRINDRQNTKSGIPHFFTKRSSKSRANFATLRENFSSTVRTDISMYFPVFYSKCALFTIMTKIF